MLFSIEELKKIFPHNEGKTTNNSIVEIMLDSRKETEASLFIPIVGERFNAHDFIDGAVQKGAVASLWDKNYDLPAHLKDSCCFFYVDDTVKALQELAKYYRQRVNPTVIGITGSNGKTTTKDIVASLLETTYRTHKTAGNFNNDIGLPLTVLSMPEDTEILVLEMGMNDFGEIDLLSQLSTPDYAIITNIGESHIEFLGSRAGIAQAKLEIVNGLKETGTVIIDGDEALLQSIEFVQKVISCGFTKINPPSSTIRDVTVELAATSFTLDNAIYKIPLTGAHHAKNATFAIVLAKMLGIKEDEIRKGLANIQYSQMRFETSTHSLGATLINDAYNASPTSMIGAIDVVKQLTEYKTKLLVLGDVFELGDRAIEFHEQIGQSITEPINGVYTIGTNAKRITDIVSRNEKNIESKHFPDEERLINFIQSKMDKDTIILFKASRGMAFENMINKIMDN